MNHSQQKSTGVEKLFEATKSDEQPDMASRIDDFLARETAEMTNVVLRLIDTSSIHSVDNYIKRKQVKA